MTDFYKILEVLPNAAQEEIKRSYRRLARLYHPDGANIHTSTKTFHDIQRAYETLSDPALRRIYDKKNGFENWAQEKIDAYRKSQSQTEKETAKTRQTSSAKAASAAAAEKKTAAKGAKAPEGLKTKFVKVKQSLEEEVKSFTSKAAESMGLKADAEHPRQIEVVIDAWESLRGIRKEIDVSMSNRPRIVRVKFPPGIAHGAVLRVKCPAVAGYEAERVDVRVLIGPHQFIERTGLDVLVRIPITVGEAVLGTELNVPTLHGSMAVKIPSGWTCEKDIRIKGQGVEHPVSKKCGDFFVRTYIVIPAKLTRPAVEAAQIIDSCYREDVRAAIPRSLT